MSDEPDSLMLRCPACQTGLRVRARLAGTQAKCPQCGAKIQIPVRADIDLEPEADVRPPAAEGEYRLAEAISYHPDDHPEPLPAELRPIAPAAGFLDQMGSVRQEKIDRPSRHVFFSGVFEFPWYPEVWIRWLFLVLGGSVATLIPVMALYFIDGSSGYVGVGLAFFAMPQIWISIWTGSFAAACGLQVFDDTASGSDHVNSWPEPNWREWMWPLMYLGYVAFMVMAVSYGFGMAAGASSRAMWISLMLCEFFLFPICLLSVMESNNLAILISPAMISSLVRKPLDWVCFYLLTGLMFALWLGVATLVWQIHPALLIVVNGVLYATITLIWFRLLGRLAWAITHRRSKKPRRESVAAAPSPS